MRQHNIPTTAGIRKLVHKLRTRTSEPNLRTSEPKLPPPYKRLMQNLIQNRVTCACIVPVHAYFILCLCLCLRRTCGPALIVHYQNSPSQKNRVLCFSASPLKTDYYAWNYADCRYYARDYARRKGISWTVNNIVSEVNPLALTKGKTWLNQ